MSPKRKILFLEDEESVDSVMWNKMEMLVNLLTSN